MADARMPQEFFDQLEPHLPPEEPMGPKRGRPRTPHVIAMKVIWYVLTTGCRWENVPLELGCSGRTAHRRLRAWEELGIWDRLHGHLLKLLHKAGLRPLWRVPVHGRADLVQRSRLAVDCASSQSLGAFGHDSDED